jgi:hypothetical protein
MPSDGIMSRVIPENQKIEKGDFLGVNTWRGVLDSGCEWRDQAERRVNEKDIAGK